MSNIAFLLLFSSIFIPGILWNHIVITYSKKRKPSHTIFIIWSFIFGFWVYGIELLVYGICVVIESIVNKICVYSIDISIVLMILSIILFFFSFFQFKSLIKNFWEKRYEQQYKYLSAIGRYYSIFLIFEPSLLYSAHSWQNSLEKIKLLNFVNLYVVSIIILALPVAFLLGCFHLWLNEKEILLESLKGLSLTQKSATEKETWELVLDNRTRSFDKDQKNKAEVWDFEKGIIVTGILQNASETGEPKALFLTGVTVESFYCEGNRVERKEIERDKKAMYMDVEKALVFLSSL